MEGVEDWAVGAAGREVEAAAAEPKCGVLGRDMGWCDDGWLRGSLAEDASR